jgi:hypothetical protein
MPVLTPELSHAFVTNIPLAPPPGRLRTAGTVADTPPVELKSVEAQSLVVGSGLIVAADQVPEQTRADLVNCTLFAQLAATAAAGESTNVREWYDAYFKTLTALGWAQSDTHFEDYQFKSSGAEAHVAVMKVLAVVLGPGAAALAVVQATFEALQEMQEDSKWLTLFDRQSKTGKSARFQVATAEIDGSGLLQVALVAFDLKAKSNFAQVLFFKFASSSTTLKYAAGRATIYEAALADQRTAIAERLAAYRTSYVAEVKLPALPGAAMPRGRSRAAGGGRRSASAADRARALLAVTPSDARGSTGRRR